jgi:hypothetical protein
MEFSWIDPLKVDGQDIATNDYPRIANPYCRVESNTKVYDISSYVRNERNGYPRQRGNQKGGRINTSVQNQE